MQALKNQNVILKRRRRWPWVLLCGFVGLSAGIFYSGIANNQLERLTWFHIDQVTIESEWPLTSKEVEKWFPSLEGKSLLALDVQALQRKIESRRWVRMVHIKKQFPRHLTIKIETEKPKAIFLKKGAPQFLDSDGQVIAPALGAKLAHVDLPTLSLGDPLAKSQWEFSEAIRLLESFEQKMNGAKVSQIVLYRYPYFDLYLASPAVRVQFSFENWWQQLPFLPRLFQNPPAEAGQIRKINLLFSKKAIVSSTISH